MSVIDTVRQYSGAALAQVGRLFGYEGAAGTSRRKAATIDNRPEDQILDAARRSQAIANSRDLARNFSLAMWAVRKHLDYVATYEFHARNDDEGLNNTIEQFVREWSRAHNFDAAGRHPLSRFIRLLEARAVMDGDAGILKLSNGQVQGIEGDRIKNPFGGSSYRSDGKYEWIHGVKTNTAGRAVAYGLHRRRSIGLEFERIVPASSLILHGYYERFDQIRGISPIISALNSFRDVHEATVFALAKAKVEQFFALAFYRGADGQLVGDADEEGAVQGRYSVNPGNGPMVLDLEVGDRAEFMGSNNPSTQFQDFMTQMIMIGLKALDIPFSFYDEAHTNFFGSRGSWLHYERSCISKREALQDVLNRLTVWRLLIALLDGELTLPSGMMLSDLKFEWVPLGMPWWDPTKEINGDLQAIGAGLDDPFNVCKQRGKGDFADNIRAIKRAMDIAAEHGVPLSFAPVVQPVQVVENSNGK